MSILSWEKGEELILAQIGKCHSLFVLRWRNGLYKGRPPSLSSFRCQLRMEYQLCEVFLVWVEENRYHNQSIKATEFGGTVEGLYIVNFCRLDEF